LENGTETQAEMTITSKQPTESAEAKMSRDDACYNTIDETQLINVKDRFMTYTKHFKYLGSHLSYVQRPPRRLRTRRH
jgi:hypothetical protein